MSAVMKPILFSTPMVQAILDGRKTMTRRVVKPQPKLLSEASNHKHNMYSWKDGMYALDMYPTNSLLIKEASRYQVGDILWVRETWQECKCGFCEFCNNGDSVIYKASVNQDGTYKNYYTCVEDEMHWKPSIFMPKEACRIFLRVTNVRVERLKNISEDDAQKEGVEPLFDFTDVCPETGMPCSDFKTPFQELWNSINGKGAWEANPYVFVYEFEKVEKPC